MKDTSFDIDSTLQWPRWCPAHNGSPPVYDPKGYRCQKCFSLVCSMDFFITSKGARCSNCLGDIPEKERETLKPFYNKETFSSNARQNFAKVMVFGYVIAFIGWAILLVLGWLGFEDKSGQFFNSFLNFLLVLLAIFVIASTYYSWKIWQESKEK